MIRERKAEDIVVDDLVAVPGILLTAWKDAFRPVGIKLLAPLSAVYRGANRPAERSQAADILVDYAADQPRLLADLLMDADEKQFAMIYPKFKDCGDQGLPVLTGEIEKNLPPDLPSSNESREKLAKRQANSAVALLRTAPETRFPQETGFLTEKVWRFFKHSPDPRARSYPIHRLAPLGMDARTIVKQLDREPDVTIRRALLLSLGEFGERVTPGERQALLPKLQDMYRTAPDPGLHAASEWLLRQWKEEAWLAETNRAWAGQKKQQLKKLEETMQKLSKEPHHSPLTTHLIGTSMARHRRWWSFPVPWSSGWALRRRSKAA